jgi:2-iminobutanoate/2-iminopropanoate deaminase
MTSFRRIPAVPEPGELSLDAAILGDTLYTTIIPTGVDGDVVGDDIETQSRVLLDNLRDVLEAAGSGLEHVAHLTIYLTDIARDRLGFNEVYREYFSQGRIPVRCAVGVAALARPEMLVEVTAVAAVPAPSA